MRFNYQSLVNLNIFLLSLSFFSGVRLNWGFFQIFTVLKSCTHTCVWFGGLTSTRFLSSFQRKSSNLSAKPKRQVFLTRPSSLKALNSKQSQSFKNCNCLDKLPGLMKILSPLWLGLSRKCDLAMTKVFSSFGYVNSFLKTVV